MEGIKNTDTRFGPFPSICCVLPPRYVTHRYHCLQLHQRGMGHMPLLIRNHNPSSRPVRQLLPAGNNGRYGALLFIHIFFAVKIIIQSSYFNVKNQMYQMCQSNGFHVCQHKYFPKNFLRVPNGAFYTNPSDHNSFHWYPPLFSIHYMLKQPSIKMTCPLT